LSADIFKENETECLQAKRKAVGEFLSLHYQLMEVHISTFYKLELKLLDVTVLGDIKTVLQIASEIEQTVAPDWLNFIAEIRDKSCNDNVNCSNN
jgi:hypothetical protein